MRHARAPRLGLAAELCCLATVAVLLGAVPGSGQNLPFVPTLEANRHIVKRVQPAWPMTSLGQMQGTVVLEATIDESGRVISVGFISGPPLLVQSAFSALRRFRYRPFFIKGVASKVNTLVPFSFSLRVHNRQLIQEAKETMAYSQRFVQCRSLLLARNYADAAEPCAALPRLAEALPSYLYLERVDAYHYAGQLALKEHDDAAAVTLFRREVLAAKILAPQGGVGLGRAYEELADAYEGEGEPKQAEGFLMEAVSAYKGACGYVLSGVVKARCEQTLVSLLRRDAAVLGKLGRPRDSARVTREAEKLAARIRH